MLLYSFLTKTILCLCSIFSAVCESTKAWWWAMLQRVSNPVNIDVSLLRKLHKILTVFLFLFLVVSMDYSMEGTNITLAVFIPTAIVLVIVLGIYVYFVKWVTSLNFIYCICRQRRLCRMFSFFFFHSLLRLQGKSVRMPTSSPPYDNMTEESAFDNPIYESGVSTDVMSMQDIDSQNTSVLSWSSSIPLLSSQRHLISRQQRAPSPSITISIISEIKYWTLWYHLPVGIFHTSFLYSGFFFIFCSLLHRRMFCCLFWSHSTLSNQIGKL